MVRVAGSVVFAATLAMASLVSSAVGAQSPSRRPLFVQAILTPSNIYPAPQTATAQVASAEAGGYSPAPVPDQDEIAPTVRPLGPAEPELAPSLFKSPHSYRGEGFTPGSSVQDSQNRYERPGAGVSLNVPLE